MEFEHEIVVLLASLRERAPAGFAIALHVRFAAPTYLFQTYPPEWRDAYSQHGYVMSDPTVHWGLAHSGYITWDQLSRDDPAGVLAHAARFGMSHGVTIATGEGGSQSLASFSRPDRDYDAGEIGQLDADFQILHQRTSGLSSLSPETAEALRRLSVTVTHR